MRATPWTITALIGVTLAAWGCPSAAPLKSAHPSSSDDASTTCTPGDPGVFERSQGGVPEVSPSWAHQNRCRVRLVDVREAHEFKTLGLADDAQHVELGALTDAARQWSPDEPIVLLCRSGRRSARAVALLEQQGFTRVASMTGGMLAWQAHKLPLTSKPAHADHAQTPTSAASPASLAPIKTTLPTDPERLSWVKAASLLVNGAVSCVDGRTNHSIIGAPGGDAGELLLAISTLEQLSGVLVNAQKLSQLVGAYIEAFGSIYLHTDAHALERLGHTLRADPSFSAWSDRLTRHEDIEAFVRHPPHQLEAQLLRALVTPAHTGCGHLRLILERAQDYGVRAELTSMLLSELYRRMWQTPEQLSFHVLAGEHHEEAVVTVSLSPAPLHAYSMIPAIEPAHHSRQVFVYHPQAVDFVRAQETDFILERSAWLLGVEVDRATYEANLRAVASKQLKLTLDALAKGLPHYTLQFEAPAPPKVIPTKLTLQE